MLKLARATGVLSSSLAPGKYEHVSAELSDQTVDLPQAVADHDVVGGLTVLVDVPVRGLEKSGQVKQFPASLTVITQRWRPALNLGGTGRPFPTPLW